MSGMSKGEYRVGINFNPSGDDLVAGIKRAASDLIDLIESVPMKDFYPVPDLPANEIDLGLTRLNEVVRLKALAQTAIEDGAMWAVKAATKPQMEVAS